MNESMIKNESEVKPGYKTTEFWLTVAASVIGAAFASGAFGDDSAIAQGLGMAAMVLTNMGYQVSRGIAKK